jgi:hypothetical protein
LEEPVIWRQRLAQANGQHLLEVGLAGDGFLDAVLK